MQNNFDLSTNFESGVFLYLFFHIIPVFPATSRQKNRATSPPDFNTTGTQSTKSSFDSTIKSYGSTICESLRTSARRHPLPYQTLSESQPLKVLLQPTKRGTPLKAITPMRKNSQNQSALRESLERTRTNTNRIDKGMVRVPSRKRQKTSPADELIAKLTALLVSDWEYQVLKWWKTDDIRSTEVSDYLYILTSVRLVDIESSRNIYVSTPSTRQINSSRNRNLRTHRWCASYFKSRRPPWKSCSQTCERSQRRRSRPVCLLYTT